MVRATDHAVEPPSGFARNDYSRRQAFNANNTRVLVYSLNGAWHLYDANSLQPLRVLKTAEVLSEFDAWTEKDDLTAALKALAKSTALLKK